MKRSTRVSSKTVESCSYLDDDGVIAHASASESGDKFKALYAGNWEEGYDSQSDADMALVSILAFWCGNVEEQIDRIFRTSGLMRDKWDRHTGDSTYGQITIRNVVSTNSEIYTPIACSSAEDDFECIDEENNEKLPDFRPDLSHIILTLEEMQPHTNPRYQREEIGIGNAFADYFKPIARFKGIAMSGMCMMAQSGSRMKIGNRCGTVSRVFSLAFGTSLKTVSRILSTR